MDIEKKLSVTKHLSRLSTLEQNFRGGVSQQKKRREKEKKLRTLLQYSLFLREDEKRRKKWLQAIPSITMDLLDRLIPAIIREDLRYKEKKRNLVVELNKRRAKQTV